MPLVRSSLPLACLGAALAALLLSACGAGSEPTTPPACFEGAAAYAKALSAAPAEVRVNGETLISECFAERQASGDLEAVGEALVTTATRLNGEARAEPGGQANLELGYLLGAASAGSEATQGIHANLLRRLEVAARYAPGGQPLSPRFLAAYREGFDAGEEQG
ncbi:MAG: hypothetical protein JST31_09005 [Actinobacteria bacterium]|nr:hypothetical protein [Actinomycetota bacterium]